MTHAANSPSYSWLPGAALSRGVLLQLAVMAALVVAPFAAFQPLAVTALAAILITWRGWRAWQDAPAPPRWLLIPIAITGVTLVHFSLGRVLGKESGLAVLCLLLPLKLLETRQQRDAKAAVLLSFFLLLGQFLHLQNAWTAASSLLGAIAVLATLMRLLRPHVSPSLSLKLAGRLVLQGMPLMLILFLLFPRIDGPLWGLPMDAYSGLTGLSDRMAPGAISNLVQSREIVMRAEFDGAPPPPVQRYWRGPVLSEFDGNEWQPRRFFSSAEPSYELLGRSYRYRLTLEPHNQRWLLALDFPRPGVDEQSISPEFVLRQAMRLRSRQRLLLTSFPDARVGQDEDIRTLQANLRLPAGSNPRSQAQGQQIARQTPRVADRVPAILQFMRSANLIYTLQPPITTEHSADAFLFDTKRGFCEHFASSFAVLARAAGLPTRIVTGYQGGEVNPVDGALVVRQSDAHAWAEVWLEGRGWQRVDPTAASYPSRLDGGLLQALPDGEALPFALRQGFSWMQDLRYRWDALNNAWNQWIIGYNAERQMALLRNLGISQPDWRQLVGLLAALGGSFVLWLTWRAWPRATRPDALDRVWLGLCRQLARRGWQRQHWEAPADFVARIAIQDAALARQVQTVTERYAELRFGRRTPTGDDIAQLRRAATRALQRS